jgi:hypothetical protein
LNPTRTVLTDNGGQRGFIKAPLEVVHHFVK